MGRAVEAVEQGCAGRVPHRQPAGPGWLGARCPDHVRRSLPAATQRLRLARDCAGAPSVRVARRAGVPRVLAQRPRLPARPQSRLATGAGRVDLPAAKTFIMGWTPEGLGGDLRCRPFSEVHAQMGNLPDLYTGACVVRQKQLYLAGIPSPGSCLRCIIGNYEWKKVRVKRGRGTSEGEGGEGRLFHSKNLIDKIIIKS